MDARKSKSKKRERRTFTKGFKRESVQMLLDGHSAKSVSKNLGIGNTNLLYRWRAELVPEGGSVAELPASLARFVTEASQAIGCDPSYIVLPLLAALAAAIGDACRLQVKKGWEVPAILWAAFVGESGTAKTPAFQAVMKYAKQREEEHHQRHQELEKAHRHDMAKYDEQFAKWKSKLGYQPNTLMPDKPIQSPRLRIVVSDSTIESLSEILADNPAGLLCLHDELAAFFGGMDKYRSKGDSDSATWLTLYGGGSISVDRKGGGHTYVFNGYVSIAGGIQPSTLARCFTSKNRDSGLSARFLMAWPPRISKQWTEAEIGDETDSQTASIFDYWYKLSPQIDDVGKRTPHLLQLNAEAKQLWIQFYNSHNMPTNRTIKDDVAAAFSKLEEQPLRVAIVFHCVRIASGLTQGQLIESSTIQSAITLTEWFKNEARRIYSLLDQSNKKAKTTDLIQWIAAKGVPITARELQQGRRDITSADQARNVLNGLVESGHGEWVPTPPGTLGKPTQRFKLFPSTSTELND